MKRGTFIATVALLIAIAGAIVAFAAYFKRRTCSLCDDFDDEMMDDDLSDLDYYATQVDDEDYDEEEAPAEAPVQDGEEPSDEPVNPANPTE